MISWKVGQQYALYTPCGLVRFLIVECCAFGALQLSLLSNKLVVFALLSFIPKTISCLRSELLCPSVLLIRMLHPRDVPKFYDVSNRIGANWPLPWRPKPRGMWS